MEREQAEQPPPKKKFAVFLHTDPPEMLATRLTRLTNNDGYTIVSVFPYLRDFMIVAWREE